MSKKSDRQFKEACSAWDGGDLPSAFALFAEAAEAGDDGSQLNLGYFYDHGIHVTRNRIVAKHWYHRAYRQGNASAANNVATIYRDAREYGRMVWWWRAAVRMGDGDALLELGRCYEAGRGVLKNRDRAADCYVRLLALDVDQTTEASREMAEGRLKHLRRRGKDAGIRRLSRVHRES